MVVESSSSWAQSATVKKVVWAIDAFETDKKLHRNAVKMLLAISEKTGAEIEPVYILSLAQLNLTSDVPGPWILNYRPAAEKALQTLVSDFYIPNLKRPQVLMQKSSSNIEATMLISKYAKSVSADLIVVSSHSRTGVSRLLLGSFTETLILHASVPVMVVGTHLHELPALDHIIFPTKFGSHSKFIFRRVVLLAKALNAHLTLFHSVPPLTIEPLFQSGVYLLGGAWIPVQSYFANEVERKKRRIKLWCQWARQKNIRTDYEIQSEGGDIAESILNLAERKKSGFIAMEGQSGRISAALIGSVTRQVLRHSTCPVWVIRYSMEAEKRGPDFGEHKQVA